VNSNTFPLATHFAIAKLQADQAAFIDADQLEDWLDFFTEDCVYRVIPAENIAQGLPACLILCTNRNMLRDRVVALRVANEYNIHTDRHLVGFPRVIGHSDSTYIVESSYAVFQTDQEGESRLFSVGKYLDKIVFMNGEPKFKEKTVVVDTSAVPTMLAVPL
jgi:anthranilate 1,2-dioxygenase small subunit